jgi:hypothetical protein
LKNNSLPPPLTKSINGFIHSTSHNLALKHKKLAQQEKPKETHESGSKKTATQKSFNNPNKKIYIKGCYSIGHEKLHKNGDLDLLGHSL